MTAWKAVGGWDAQRRVIALLWLWLCRAHGVVVYGHDSGAPLSRNSCFAVNSSLVWSPEDVAAHSMFADLRRWFGGKDLAYCSTDFPKVAECPTFLPPAARVVAIGDLHGDMQKARQAFRIGGLIDERDRWIGGTTTAVQVWLHQGDLRAADSGSMEYAKLLRVGDQLDRGDNEIEILYFLERLQKEAAAAGGELHVLNGNHETMNVDGRFRYATIPGLADFHRWHVVNSIGKGLKARCGCTPMEQPASPTDKSADALPVAERTRPRVMHGEAAAAARLSALNPGGAITTRFLARHPVVLQVGSTVFVHGGILPEHARYGLTRLNAEAQQWMLGVGAGRIPAFLAGTQAIVWTRDYSAEVEARCQCNKLADALALLPGAERMVVGHTIQDAGINAACDGRVFRIDVGLSRGCGDGEPEVLEILDDKEVRRLSRSAGPSTFREPGAGHQDASSCPAGSSTPHRRLPLWEWAAKTRQPQPSA